MSIQFALNNLKFEDVRSQIVDFLASNSEFSGQFDFNAANMGLIIDTMSYVSMLMSYQVSNTANNLFLDTTTIRKNAISIAKTMGYRPKRLIGARVTGTIQYYDIDDTFEDGHYIRIPALTQFVSDGGFIFVNYEDVLLTVDPFDSHLLKSTVILHEGSEKTYSYLGNGVPFQTFTIPSKKVDENNFNLYVKKNNISDLGTKWEEVKLSFNLIDKNSYFVEEDLNTEGYVRVVFGDNDITNYPTNSEIVTVKYIETNGTIANTNKIISMSTANFEFKDKNLIKVYTIVPEKFTPITDTTGISYGAKDLETLEEIQARCPKAFATVGRAVTENDYKTLLKDLTGAYKTNSVGGDTLYPNNHEKLGNIYLTAIPSINSIQGDIFSNKNKIYLTDLEENQIYTELNRFRIISTQINFIKPSYVSVVIDPSIECKSNTNQSELTLIKNNIATSLQTYFTSTYNDFAQPFRSSKINGIISETNGIVSSSFTTKYYFALAKDSFYDVVNFSNNMLYLPIIIKSKDVFGNVTEYENFIRTNDEQKQLLNKTTLETYESTIFGKIANSNIERYLYNKDVASVNGVTELSDIMVDGKNKFFEFYRFDANLSSVEPISVKTFNTPTEGVQVLNITPAVTADVGTGLSFDSYTLRIGTDLLGTIRRTNNRENGFNGVISQEGDIVSTSNGTFYKAVASFPITGTDKTFYEINKNDTIIYNASLTGDKWIKAVDKGYISANSDAGLFNLITHNTIYTIANNGTFDGRLPNGVEVSGGDNIIFNVNSTINPYKWEVINHRNDPVLNFDASTPIVKEVVDYEMKRVIDTYLGQTTFGGRSNALSEDDLIYYDPLEVIEIDKWKLVCNTSLSGSINDLDTIDCLPLSGGSLEEFNYSVTGIPVGTVYRVTNIGNFGTSKGRINWPSDDDTAFDGDVILYVGDGRWNIWQDSQPDTFNIDGNFVSSLPIKMTYGDMFQVSVSGDFFGGLDRTYNVDDSIVYVGNNTWIPLVISQPVSGLDASSANNLPHEAAMGDMFTVNEDGNFDNSYMIRPANDTFVQGDVIIYTGTFYTKVNEYTFDYNALSEFTSSRDTLNDYGFNYVFRYEFNNTTNLYEFYFDDIFNNTKLGTFRYVSTSTENLYDVGKIIFEPYIVGKYDLNDITTQVGLDNLFDDTTINKIEFLPKNKRDKNGLLTTVQEDNFDTIFNTFIIASSNTIGTVI